MNTQPNIQNSNNNPKITPTLKVNTPEIDNNLQNSKNLIQELEKKLIQQKMFKAIVAGNVKELQAMLDAGADANALDDFGNSALHKVVSQSKPETGAMIKILLANHANIDCVNSKGETPVLLAYKNKNFHEARDLAKSGADMNIVDKQGISVMVAIAKHGNVQEYSFAKQNGLKPEIKHFGFKMYQRSSRVKIKDKEGREEYVNIPMPQEIASQRDSFELAEHFQTDFQQVVNTLKTSLELAKGKLDDNRKDRENRTFSIAA